MEIDSAIHLQYNMQTPHNYINVYNDCLDNFLLIVACILAIAYDDRLE